MSTVAALEKQLEDALEDMRLRDAAIRLYSNREFKEVVLEGFCLKDCAEYAQRSGNVAIPANQRADALAMAQASGYLRSYLSVVVQKGNHAEENLPALREMIEDARRGE